MILDFMFSLENDLLWLDIFHLFPRTLKTVVKNLYLLQNTDIVTFYNLYMEIHLGILNPGCKIMMRGTSCPLNLPSFYSSFSSKLLYILSDFDTAMF